MSLPFLEVLDKEKLSQSRRKAQWSCFKHSLTWGKYRLICSLSLAQKEYYICSKSRESVSETKVLFYVSFSISYYSAYQGVAE